MKQNRSNVSNDVFNMLKQLSKNICPTLVPYVSKDTYNETFTMLLNIQNSQIRDMGVKFISLCSRFTRHSEDNDIENTSKISDKLSKIIKDLNNIKTDDKFKFQSIKNQQEMLKEKIIVTSLINMLLTFQNKMNKSLLSLQDEMRMDNAKVPVLDIVTSSIILKRREREECKILSFIEQHNDHIVNNVIIQASTELKRGRILRSSSYVEEENHSISSIANDFSMEHSMEEDLHCYEDDFSCGENNKNNNERNFTIKKINFNAESVNENLYNSTIQNTVNVNQITKENINNATNNCKRKSVYPLFNQEKPSKSFTIAIRRKKICINDDKNIQNTEQYSEINQSKIVMKERPHSYNTRSWKSKVVEKSKTLELFNSFNF